MDDNQVGNIFSFLQLLIQVPPAPFLFLPFPTFFPETHQKAISFHNTPTNHSTISPGFSIKDRTNKEGKTELGEIFHIIIHLYAPYLCSKCAGTATEDT